MVLKTQPHTFLRLGAGGAEGPKQAGFIDEALKDGTYFDGIAGASAGAVNAALIKKGWGDGGPDGARQALYRFWHDPALHMWMTGNHFVPRRMVDAAHRSASAMMDASPATDNLWLGMFRANVHAAQTAGLRWHAAAAGMYLDALDDQAEYAARQIWNRMLDDPHSTAARQHPLYTLLCRHLGSDAALQHGDGPVVDVTAVAIRGGRPQERRFSSVPAAGTKPLTIDAVYQSAAIAPYLPPLDGHVDGIYAGDALHSRLPADARVLYLELTHKVSGASRYMRRLRHDPQRYSALLDAYEAMPRHSYDDGVQASHVVMTARGDDVDFKRLFPLPAEIPHNFANGRAMHRQWRGAGGFDCRYTEAPRAVAALVA